MTSLDLEDATNLARSLAELLRAAEHGLPKPGGESLTAHIVDHIGCPMSEVPNVSTSFPSWELVNLQLGVDAYRAEHSAGAPWFGIAGTGRHHQDLVDMMTYADRHGGYQLGAVDYTTVASGPDRTCEVVQLGLVRSVAPNGQPVVIAMRGQIEHSGEQGCSL